MKIEAYMDYIRRFNERDVTTFDQYLAPDVVVDNGQVHYQGIDGMKAHYAKVWAYFEETINVVRFVSDDKTAAVEMKTHFVATVDGDDTPLGPVKRGETIDFHGIGMYDVGPQGFRSIQVAYLSLTHTDLQGKVTRREL